MLKVIKEYKYIAVINMFAAILLYGANGLSLKLLSALFLINVLLFAAHYDIKKRIIPNKIVVSGLFGGLLLLLSKALIPAECFTQHWLDNILGMIIVPGILLSVLIIGRIIVKSDVVGMGDIKIFMPIGMILGWRLSVAVLALTIVLSGLASIIKMLVALKLPKGWIALAPYVAAGTFIVIFINSILIVR